MYRIMRLPMTWKPVTPLQPYEGFPAQLCEPGRGPPGQSWAHGSLADPMCGPCGTNLIPRISGSKDLK